MHLRVGIIDPDPHGFQELCLEYTGTLRISLHYSFEQAAASALRQFRRSVLSRVEALSVAVEMDTVSGKM